MPDIIHLLSALRDWMPPKLMDCVRNRRVKRHIAAWSQLQGLDPLADHKLVEEAKAHLEAATRHCPQREMPASVRWETFAGRMQSRIQGISTPRAAIDYAQSDQIEFDHRLSAKAAIGQFGLHESTLRSDFPEFAQSIDVMGESPCSSTYSLLKSQSRLISNILFWQMSILLKCLRHVPYPTTVCEVGGGYGGPARLWLDNPVHRPTQYTIIDFPESLFFAEVFLRASLPDLSVLYVTGEAPVDPVTAADYGLILCPITAVGALSNLSFDLVMNTGSLQEMTEEWVDFWMGWLRGQDCRWFASLNYFANPLGGITEGANTWCPRLSPEWVTRNLDFDPQLVMQQTPRHYAWVIAEKLAAAPPPDRDRLLARYESTMARTLDGALLLEMMDVVRCCYDEGLMWSLLTRCTTEMRPIPREAYYLADYLTRNASDAFHASHGPALGDLHSRLTELRTQGAEDWYR